MNAHYKRVIPRDLFNESKLLKCMGQLALKIHDETTPVPMEMREEINHEGSAFRIALLDEGALMIVNLWVRIKSKSYQFKTTYNSKAPYPLFMMYENYNEVEVFDDKGEWHPDFIEFCKQVK